MPSSGWHTGDTLCVTTYIFFNVQPWLTLNARKGCSMRWPRRDCEIMRGLDNSFSFKFLHALVKHSEAQWSTVNLRILAECYSTGASTYPGCLVLNYLNGQCRENILAFDILVNFRHINLILNMAIVLARTFAEAINQMNCSRFSTLLIFYPTNKAGLCFLCSLFLNRSSRPERNFSAG